ncbi:MAG TPA: nuclear transport factor 2 family protein [Candidatus Dormibacteraeota bacterium]
MPEAAQIRKAVETYVQSFNTKDKHAFLSVFAEGVQQIDPVGSKPNVGKHKLAAFWDTLFSQVEKIDFRVTDLFITGDEAALLFHITQSKKDGDVVVDGVDVFQVNDAGHITLIKGYSDANHVRSNSH